jgi:hypothetical protein
MHVKAHMTSKPKSFNVLSFLKVWKKWDFWFFAENQKAQNNILYFQFFKKIKFSDDVPVIQFPDVVLYTCSLGCAC